MYLLEHICAEWILCVQELTAVAVVLLRGWCRQCVPFLSHYVHILYVCEQLYPYLLLGAEGESVCVCLYLTDCMQCVSRGSGPAWGGQTLNGQMIQVLHSSSINYQLITVMQPI